MEIQLLGKAIELAHLVAVFLGGWLLLTTLQQLTSDEDPSFAPVIRSDVGTLTFLVSGAFLPALLVGVIMTLTWPAPVARPAFGGLLMAILLAHLWLEYQEARS